jgi:hypothetical protein
MARRMDYSGASLNARRKRRFDFDWFCFEFFEHRHIYEYCLVERILLYTGVLVVEQAQMQVHYFVLFYSVLCGCVLCVYVLCTRGLLDSSSIIY